MADAASFQCPDGKIQVQQDSSKVQTNLSGLKHALHGTSYQLKLGIVVCLANAKNSMDPAKNFSFTVMAEDPTAGKFDDIVYNFKDGETKGTLYIQAKHKMGSPVTTITLANLTTTKESSNQFGILKYFTSFYDQQQPNTDMEGLIICTNSGIEDNAKAILKTVERAGTNDSVISLDFFILSLFESIGGQCYQLDYDKLLSTDGMINNFHQSLRKCSKRARLARLLVDATRPKKKIASNNSLYKDHRHAILNLIDRSEPSTNDSYKFTEEFLDSSFSSSKQGYEAFRKEFEDQYRQEFKIEGSVWEDLQMKRLHVAKDFLSDEKNECASSDIFPDDDVNDSFKAFCDRFRLVCGTKNEHELDDAITELWKNLYADDNRVIADRGMGCTEEKMVTEKLFKTNFDWLMDPFANPLYSEDIKLNLEKIEHTLAHMKLKGISNKLRKQLVRSPFRISHDALKASDLYEQIESESLLDVEAYDVKFCTTLLVDIFALQCKDLGCILFLDDLDFTNDSGSIENMLHYIEQPICLIVVCNESFRTVQRIVRKWKKMLLKHFSKQVILIKKISDVITDLSGFCIRDLTEESWKQFLRDDIRLCTTKISPDKIFQDGFNDLSIEEVIKLMDWGEHMEENNEVEKKYKEIEHFYTHRYWVNHESTLVSENLNRSDHNEMFKILRRNIEHQKGNISFKEITKPIKKQSKFNIMFTEANDSAFEHEPIIGDDAKKVLILFAEAGFGKSTNVIWLAWYLRKRIPSSWVVHCILSNHCFDFRQFMESSCNQVSKAIDENAALKMLYELIQLSSAETRRADPQSFRLNAEKCSECLFFSHGSAVLNKEQMKYHGLSLNDSLHLLLFKEKFNAGEFVLVFDGFDEIAPHYKEVVLEFLTYFEKFKGVRKLYLTSRPYGFKEHFATVFKDPSFFQLKPLTLQDKGYILYKMMKLKWHKGNDDDEEISDFYKALCFSLLYHLHEMSDIPLNLMMAVDILVRPAHQYVHIPTKTISPALFMEIERIFKPSLMVDEFVKNKILHSLYTKIGADENAIYNPQEIERFEKALDEAKSLHGQVALWVLFDKSVREVLLSIKEMREAKDYMNAIEEAREKTGIINGLQLGVPIFIHRTFAEYLAAWWMVKKQLEENQQSKIKLSSIQSFWDRERYELRKHMDIILAKHHPLHLAIVEKNREAADSILAANPNALHERDDGNRTPLHLWAFYFDFEHDWPTILHKSVEFDRINEKEKLFGWTALDYAFLALKFEWNSERDYQFIFYLLNQGALINVDMLYEQLISSERIEVRDAVKYPQHVMRYLSRQAIEYESHDACKKIKQFCDKVAHYLVNNTNKTFSRKIDQSNINRNDNKIFGLSDKENSVIKDIISEDSLWMLESMIKKHSWPLGDTPFFQIIVESGSVFTMKYVAGIDPSVLDETDLWKCIVYSVNHNYKNEFKYFFDLYCSRMDIVELHQYPIQSHEACYVIDCLDPTIMKDIIDFRENILWNKFHIPAKVTIDKNILSLLVLCIAIVRPSMLRYLNESCDLKLCSGLVYCLAMITTNLFAQIDGYVRKDQIQSYECLLDMASHINDNEANEILRLAMTSSLFQFSKCLIERYKIDFQVVDELKGWNVFHLCVSDQRSFFVEEFATSSMWFSLIRGFRTYDNKIDFFHYMLEKEKNMDCYSLLDIEGRSIIQIAIENGQNAVVDDIMARKLGLKNINEIENLNVDAIPNLIFCYRAIHAILKSSEEKGYHHTILCTLAKQIALILLTNDEKTQESNSGRFLLEKDAEELYQIAMKCRSLFLMYYLHREFHTNSSSFHDADWLVCTAKSLKSPDFNDVTKWLLNDNGVEGHVICIHVLKKIDAIESDLGSLDLEELVRAEPTSSANESLESIRKIKLVVLAVCLKLESAIRYLCETLNVKIERKLLIDIMSIAHHSNKYACDFYKPNFDPIFKYLLERTSDLNEIDAEGRNVLHHAVQSGLCCMAKFLIENNMFSIMAINEQNNWNIFHYFAAKENCWSCWHTKHDDFMICMTRRVLEITSLNSIFCCLNETHKNKIKELCFKNKETGSTAIHVAVKAGNVKLAESFICLRLGIMNIDKHKIKTPDECSRIVECFEMLNQAVEQLPFNAKTETLLYRLARTIESFSYDISKNLTGQANVADVCRTAIKYRSFSTLEHLIMHCSHPVNQAFARSTTRELVACMTECIRRNKFSLFKVLVDHYCTLQGIRNCDKIEYGNKENDNNKEIIIDENQIQWSLIDRLPQDVLINRDYLILLILSVAYGRLTIAKFMDKIFQLSINTSLIVLIMKVLIGPVCVDYIMTAPVYEYLASRCAETANLLKLCIQATDLFMIEFLIKYKHYDPNEIVCEKGWNIGHYCVSEPANDVNSWYAINVFELLINDTHMDCFGIYDRNGRSILHLALENGFIEVVKYIIHHRLRIKDEKKLKEWDLKKIENHINELHKIIESIPNNIAQNRQQVIYKMLEKVTDRKIALAAYSRLFKH